MKNIFFSLLILSSSLIHSTDIKVNVKKKQELQPLYQQKIYSSSLDEENIDFDIQENDFLNNNITHETHAPHGWKILKGVAGLWIGAKLFSFGGKGLLLLFLRPDHLDRLSGPSSTLSPVEKLLTNRSFWLSLCGACTAFSVVILKKSADNLYQGLYPTENTMEYFETDL